MFYEKEWNYIWNYIEYTFLALKQEIVWGCAEILPLLVFQFAGGNCYNINFNICCNIVNPIIEADESSKSVTIPFEQNYEVDFPILSILSVHECPLDWKYYIFFSKLIIMLLVAKMQHANVAPQLKKISLVLMATS